MDSNIDGKLDANEVMESLTGYEEIGIRKVFGRDIFTLADEDASGMLRALVFVVKKREPGVKEADAKAYALGLTIKQTQDAFTSDDEPEAPEVGEGGPLDG